MKLSILGGLFTLAATASALADGGNQAWKLTVWTKNDFQGEKKIIVRVPTRFPRPFVANMLTLFLFGS
jgi:hypothetical protein